ncbi:MAG: PspC domain-containing protein, partial [Bacteroidales bacterium]|nr:PspC domain-containing protein [Bacteroidales bacterium]
MKKFQRSRKNVMIAGVCGGLGEYFNIDPILFRIIFVLLAVSGSLGVWIYLLLWLFSQPADAPSHRTYRQGPESSVEDVDFTYVDEP